MNKEWGIPKRRACFSRFQSKGRLSLSIVHHFEGVSQCKVQLFNCLDEHKKFVALI
jgi:hypothetical protein